MTVWVWSKTADSNNSIDDTVNWREGQSPGSVNGSARAMMAAIAKWRDDMSGNVVTGGTATAYTVTSNQVFTELADGISITVRMHATNGSSATLNVDSLGAKPIANVYGSAMTYGALPSGSIQRFTYDSTDDKWIAHNAREKAVATGVYWPFGGATAPGGWLISNGLTVGNASSNATALAHASAEDLFNFLWTNYADTTAPIFTSAGASSTRGASAAADWAANKAIATINTAGCTFVALDDLGAGDQGRLGDFVTPANGKIIGAEGVALTTDQLPVVTPAGSVSKPTITITNGTLVVRSTSLISGQNGGENITLPSGNAQISTLSAALDSNPTFTGTSFGHGDKHSNMQPGFCGYWIVKL